MLGRDFEKQMESVIRLFLPLFVAILLGLAPHEPALAFDGHDGGFDGAWDNDHDGGEDAASHDGDEGGENSHAGHDGAEGQSHHGQNAPHHEHHPTDRDDDARHHEKGHEKGHHHGHAWPIWAPASGFGSGFGLGLGGLGLGGFGGPGFGAFGYGTPYYPSGYYDSRPAYNPLLYPPLIFQSAPPPAYIQKQNAAQPVTGAQPGYWHYCREPEGYYPQVQECPDGWEPVAPQAPEVSVPDSRK